MSVLSFIKENVMDFGDEESSKHHATTENQQQIAPPVPNGFTPIQPTTTLGGMNGNPTFPIGAAMQFQPAVTQQMSAMSQPSVSDSSIAKFLDYFGKMLNETKLNGTAPDYHEFHTNFSNMASLGLPEDKLYQAAWVSIKGMNPSITPQQLVDSANAYLAFIENDKNSSVAKIDSQIQTETGNLTTEIQNLDNANTEATKQIQQLQATIAQNQNTILEKRQQINDRSFKLSNNKNGLLAAFDQVSASIRNDVNKISTYIH